MRAQQAAVSNEEQEEMLRNLERRETEYMRLQRRKIGIDDFEQLTLIGKGAFGEVCFIEHTISNHAHRQSTVISNSVNITLVQNCVYQHRSGYVVLKLLERSLP